MRRILFMLVALCVCAEVLAAQDTAELLARMKAMEERIQTLEAEVKALKSKPEAKPEALTVSAAPQEKSAEPLPQATAPAPVVGQLPVYGGAQMGTKIFNPDIGIIGNFVGATGRNQINPYPSLSLQESEVSMQAIVDPYARADFFLAIGENDIEVEEGYVTFPTDRKSVV